MIFRLYSNNTVINNKINDKIAASSDIAQCSDRCIERLVPTERAFRADMESNSIH